MTENEKNSSKCILTNLRHIKAHRKRTVFNDFYDSTITMCAQSLNTQHLFCSQYFIYTRTISLQKYMRHSREMRVGYSCVLSVHFQLDETICREEKTAILNVKSTRHIGLAV